MIKKHYSYPLPKFIGNYFTRNKEIFFKKNLVLLYLNGIALTTGGLQKRISIIKIKI